MTIHELEVGQFGILMNVPQPFVGRIVTRVDQTGKVNHDFRIHSNIHQPGLRLLFPNASVYLCGRRRLKSSRWLKTEDMIEGQIAVDNDGNVLKRVMGGFELVTPYLLYHPTINPPYNRVVELMGES